MSESQPTQPANKYQPVAPIPLADRTWPDKTIDAPPIWCSVDLRDGNQALIEPMGLERKLRMYNSLLEIGFKEIEIGFPAASQTDYDFCRHIIDNDLIPDDVTVQVLCQCRDELIERTFESLKGAKRAIVHIYNSTSVAQRRVVFKKDKAGITAIAQKGAEKVKQQAALYPDTDWTFQYSPESFSGTELEYAAEVCNAVIDIWQPVVKNPIIINLPNTVEVATPNIYADQIEWMGRRLNNRENIILSVHPHNDRGCGVAATELSLMAGADRVEGTLFGNGERTGNVDIITLAMNMYCQGVDPKLQFPDINKIIRMAEHCTQLPVHPRHPYAGELVFTAFSGSHQDAINKGLKERKHNPQNHWDVPYLPIDPKDLGRSYEAVIRVNSQSGKGGVAYILESEFGLQLPRTMQIEFSRAVQKVADSTGQELTGQQILSLFDDEYFAANKPLDFAGYSTSSKKEEDGKEVNRVEVHLELDGKDITCEGTGNGPIAAFITGLNKALGVDVAILNYTEHARGHGADADAVAYVQVGVNGDTQSHGCAIDADIIGASIKATISAINRCLAKADIKTESLIAHNA